ncbi:hypothetical protein D9M68_956610 [compost metagenome]
MGHAFLQLLLARIESQIEAAQVAQPVEALEHGARAEPVLHAVILQPGLHQGSGFLFTDPGLEFAGDGFRAAIGQLLRVAELGQVLGTEGRGRHGDLRVVTVTSVNVTVILEQEIRPWP